ncbi:hypothetical protein D3C72_1793760 [compost metagenome]
MRQQFTDGGTDVAAPLEYGAHGRHQLVGFAFLVQIAVRAHLEQVQRVLLRGIAAEYQHGQFRLALADRAQGIDAALIGHGYIEQQYIANFAAGDIERFAPGTGFRHHTEIVRRRKNLFESSSYYLVIITNGNAYHCFPLNFPGLGKTTGT